MTNDELRAEVERLRGALRPFALVAERDIGGCESNGDFYRPMEKYNQAPRLTVGDFRAARAALQETPDDQ